MAESDFTAASLLKHLKIAPDGVAWRLRALPGAHSNRVWHATAAGAHDCIVKHHQTDLPDNPLFANDVDVECEAARRGPVTLVPRLLARRGAWTVWRHVEGGSHHAPEEAASQLRAVHAMTPWVGLAVASGSPREWVEQGVAMLETVPLSRASDRLRACAPSAPAGPHRCTLVHRDPHPGNWVGGESAVLIDWQCAALGNPLEDFACYLSRGMRIAYGFEPATLWQASRFLAAAEIELDASWVDTQVAYDFRFACYCAWRGAMLPQAERYTRALDDYVSRAVPVSKPSIDTPLRSRQ
ncbi:MAG: phosphotransferase [Pseudomonadota bacterium]